MIEMNKAKNEESKGFLKGTEKGDRYIF